MKEGWEFGRLSEYVREFIVPQRDKPKVFSGTIPWCRIEDIVDGFVSASKTGRCVSEALVREMPLRVFPSGTVIVSCSADLGRCAIVTQPLVTNQTFIGLVPSVRLDPKFLYYLMTERARELNELATGATIKYLSQDKFRKLEIPVPPLSEQHRIVEILDKAFADIAKAKANAERNLQNARELFESQLNEVFNHQNSDDSGDRLVDAHPLLEWHWDFNEKGPVSKLNDGRTTKTGGRAASLRHINPRLSLAVGMPAKPAKFGWTWVELSNVAQLESGHTPSRSHPEYWGGSIPWIGIQDAREHHGGKIFETAQTTTELGIANSSARVLPENTVCLSRTASVGYVVIMGRPMATSQDFVNWICSPLLSPEFLKYLFLSEGRDGLHRFSSGSVHQTIYFPEAKAFCIAIPNLEEQLRIVAKLNALNTDIQRLARIYQRKLEVLDALKKSILHKAFSGEL